MIRIRYQVVFRDLYLWFITQSGDLLSNMMVMEMASTSGLVANHIKRQSQKVYAMTRVITDV